MRPPFPISAHVTPVAPGRASPCFNGPPLEGRSMRGGVAGREAYVSILPLPRQRTHAPSPTHVSQAAKTPQAGQADGTLA